jgi:excinuclease ABC subunit C
MITKEIALSMPLEPGIYIFKKNNKPIYIGKSISIRTRILSHLAQAALSEKERAIIEQSDSLDYQTTLSNFDAILLEAELIKKFRPKYNVSWKDDKNYLYIKITTQETYPKIYPVRKEDDGKSKYFGPFGSSKMTYTLIYELRRIAPFCTQKKVSKKPCFYSKLGLCNPCPNFIEHIGDNQMQTQLKKEYKNNIRKVISLLSGQSHQILTDLEKSIQISAQDEQFEDAIIARDKLLKFTLFLERRSFNKHIYAVDTDKGDLKKELSEFLLRNFNYTLSTDSYRIECYDISNLQGTYPTGSMVVVENGELSKKNYKKFSVKMKGISDIHMMREVLERRLEHSEWGYPDLIILDGGKPQLRMIYSLFKEKGVKIPLISIAKRPDRILVPSDSFKTISLRKELLLYRLIQSIRDESHRFAKKYHVLLRDRNRLN